MIFSVIIPTFNSSSTIQRALESVLKQSFKDFEIIIVDDGSSDNSKEIIYQTLSKETVSFKYIYQKNAGAAAARNNAVKNSIGTYLAFLDSDDEWHEDKLKIQYFYIQKLNAEFISTKYTFKDFNNSKDVKIRKYKFDDFLLSNRTSTPCTVITRNLFDKVNGFNFEQRYSEDYHLWLKASYYEPLYIIVEPILVRLYKYAYGESGLSSHLWAMEKGELSNYKFCYDSKYIGIVKYFFIIMYSLSKFIFRVVHSIINKFLKLK
ncbi:glycosyltransferase family 2 protein [uncultured Arcobacter sp.]|uniref:glycosyltransferase family 2 protein n=1 Tax=uncultured Arcobacter sp. TaxID=165434 RepID=UPI0026159844|nr:glycosyltransferase family 2 protein [uncultured Arcobacter sp.]